MDSLPLTAAAPRVRRYPEVFQPDPRRVLLRPHLPLTPERTSNIVERVMRLGEEECQALLDTVFAEFQERHTQLENVFERHYALVRTHLPPEIEPSTARRLLLGSYFTAEYALESAALFNPSIVPHPEQIGVCEGWLRFVMSFRATGEGHISSIEFRTGYVSPLGEVLVERPERFVTDAEVVPNPVYRKSIFERRLIEMGFDNPTSQHVLATLEDDFTLSTLREMVSEDALCGVPNRVDQTRTRDAIVWLAESNYEIRFRDDLPLSERVIFPYSSNESNGIEDARFVRLIDDDGSSTYYATYTAYNGRFILPQLLSTRDFLTFRIATLNGAAVQNKGMALFPRRVHGQYAMISRQDNENLFVMYSDNLHFWHHMEKVAGPTHAWELVQVGNCGSPIETPRGWLLLTHGVGPMRKYCIGAILLDLHDPSRVVGRLRAPLLAPNENEREGYVPNVVYTCGALLHNGRLIIPYAMSDKASSICSVALDDLLAHLAPE